LESGGTHSHTCRTLSHSYATPSWVQKTHHKPHRALLFAPGVKRFWGPLSSCHLLTCPRPNGGVGIIPPPTLHTCHQTRRTHPKKHTQNITPILPGPSIQRGGGGVGPGRNDSASLPAARPTTSPMCTPRGPGPPARDLFPRGGSQPHPRVGNPGAIVGSVTTKKPPSGRINRGHPSPPPPRHHPNSYGWSKKSSEPHGQKRRGRLTGCLKGSVKAEQI